MTSFNQIQKLSLITLMLGASPLLGCAAGTLSDDDADDEGIAEAQQADVVAVASLDFGGAFGYVNGNPIANPATGVTSCPAGYTATPVLGTTGVDYPVVFCSRPHQIGVDPLFDFGGMWGYVEGALRDNPITGAASCPAGYVDQKVSDTLNVDYPLHVCYTGHATGTVPEHPFGGLWGHVDGAQTQNPATGAASCPPSYTDTQVSGAYDVDYPLHLCWLRAGEVDFGGAFGHVDGQVVPNPATGAASCPAGYTATQVLGTAYVDYPVSFCSRPREAGVDPVYDFGGMWGYVGGALRNNPTTGAASCPVGYVDQKVSDALGTDYPLHVCFKAHAPGAPVEYHFGGMWGHVDGAPVANPATAEASCPFGFTGHQVTGTTGVDYPLQFCGQFAAGTYTAQAQVASAVVYQQVTAAVTLPSGAALSFVGHAGGVAFPGGNGSWGSLVTDDVLRLYTDTVSFEFNAAPVYFNVNFFDAGSHLLGSYHGGGVGTVTGIGGGTGTFQM